MKTTFDIFSRLYTMYINGKKKFVDLIKPFVIYFQSPNIKHLQIQKSDSTI